LKFADMWILRYALYTDGSELQYRSSGDLEHERPLGRNQKSGRCCRNHARSADLLHDHL